MRALNLYAGIGGNRALWPEDVEVTAVELDPEIAEAYKVLWPNDTVIVTDAHPYLLEHLRDGWDLIWSSPPCQSHSKLNRFEYGHGRHRYPELDQLYGEIVLLRHQAPTGVNWIVENVVPYYPPLIPPTAQLGRHYAWSNLVLPHISADRVSPPISQPRKANNPGARRRATLSPVECARVKGFEEYFGLRLPPCADHWSSAKRRQVMRNCVHPEIGRIVLNAALGRPDGVCPTLFDDGGTTHD
jgi:DNA (cytosine-5)-methyltransferase 1